MEFEHKQVNKEVLDWAEFNAPADTVYVISGAEGTKVLFWMYLMPFYLP